MKLPATLEAILFHQNSPVTYAKLAHVTGESESVVREAIQTLATQLERENRGIILITTDEECELRTNPLLAPVIQKLTEDHAREHLSQATMEVLTTVAYLGPVTRARIEEIRGVSCQSAIKTLLSRGLIDKRESDTGAMLYDITIELLAHLGVSKREELPNYAETRASLSPSINS